MTEAQKEAEKSAAPEVRQCQDPTSHLFGAVAVQITGIPGMDWGVMTVKNGGHYAADEEVEKWSKVTVVPEDAEPKTPS